MVCEKNEQKSASEKDKYITVTTKLRKMETNLEVAQYDNQFNKYYLQR